jgi:hypothetical protein
VTDDKPIVMVGEGIEFFRLRALWGACKLEGQGMRRGHGSSSLTILKQQYGFKGTRQQVMDQAKQRLDEMVERSRALHGKGDHDET